MNHRNNFNFLRIFAAVLVAVTHSYAITGNALQEPLHKFSNGTFYLSTIGLYIFFFTSGYLVSLSASNSKSPLIFLKKRILRIYPALIVVVLISVFIAGPLLTKFSLKQYYTEADTWKYLWTSSGFKIRFRLPGVFEQPGFAIAGFNGSLWTISLELELYTLLLFILLAGVFRNRRLLISLFIVLIIFCLVIVILHKHLPFFPDNKNLLLACAFFFGGLLQTGFIPKKYFTYLFLVSGVLLILKISQIIPVDILIDEVIFFSLTTYFIAFTRLFYFNIKNDISYGVYIYTFPLQQLFFQLSGFSQSVIMNLLLSLVCSCILALLSWIYIEKPALQHKNQLS
ncbi:MAG: acyltransferase [Ginsengibacter sp.]